VLPVCRSGRWLGSLVSGDAWGKPASVPWAVVYERADALLPPDRVGMPTHPYAAYELLWSLAIFALLWLLRGHALPPGARFLLLLALYGAGRFALGFLREERVVLAGLQQAQVVALALLAVAVPLLVARRLARSAA
jgi:phosphatidylglycerol:prolipoprotein diacylglycerol transferase